MAEIKAFRGMRYNTEKAGEISQLCCPPYDIISEEQRLGYISENEYNIIRLELPKEGENPYQTAREILDMWRNRGVLVSEDKLQSMFMRKNLRLTVNARASRVSSPVFILKSLKRESFFRTSSLFQRLKRTDLIL